MKDVSVEQLANIVGTPVDKILLQMKEAGLSQSSSNDLVTDDDKKTLLEFLKSQQNKVSKTISLKREKPIEPASKLTTIEIKRKKAKPSDTGEDLEGQTEKDLEWAKEMADRLERVNQQLTQDNATLKAQFKTQEDDRELPG